MKVSDHLTHICSLDSMTLTIYYHQSPLHAFSVEQDPSSPILAPPSLWLSLPLLWLLLYYPYISICSSFLPVSIFLHPEAGNTSWMSWKLHDKLYTKSFLNCLGLIHLNSLQKAA